MIRNDRFVAVPVASHEQKQLKHIHDLDQEMLKDIIHFFEYYAEMEKKEFKFLGTRGPRKAFSLIKKQLV